MKIITYFRQVALTLAKCEMFSTINSLLQSVNHIIYFDSCRPTATMHSYETEEL